MSDMIERLRATLGTRYVLERELGEGGMAVVYLAHDTRHNRPVAIKVVRTELAGTLGTERFLREIEVAARLQHPHILPVFDSGAVDDEGRGAVPYFVMPFVSGQTLRGRLEREPRLPVDEAVRVAGEVAGALAYAHGEGVVHRDIKPENILLSGGHALVADFGVAKALERGAAEPVAPTRAQLTRVGFAVGTPQYMSPEQATGRDAVDARTDQYSLACVLYEMLTGEPPFTGPTPQSVIAQSMTAPRPRVTKHRAEVPPGLERALLRAMALDPAERFPDMTAFGAALRSTSEGAVARWGSRRVALGAAAIALVAAGAGAWLARRSEAHAVAPAAETMAVLPFNVSGPDAGVLGEGMVDLLSTNLQGVGGIRTVDPRAVLSRWSSREKRTPAGLEQALAVGRELHAGSVLTGSAVSTGGRVRLAADLYSVAGERLGRAQVDGPADSVLGLVDRLSIALLRDVWRSREPIPSLQISSLTTDSLDALRAYLQGEQYYRRLVWDSALAAYTRATDVDSTFALAHLRRALVYGWTGGYGSSASVKAAAAGFRFADRLPPRDRRLLNGYRAFERGTPAAIDSLRAFVAEYPGDLEGWYLLGESLFHIQEFAPQPPDSAIAAFDHVLEGDSTLLPATIHQLDLALLYRDRARFDRTRRVFEAFASPIQREALQVAAAIAWGALPADSALRRAFSSGAASFPVMAFRSLYQRPNATSDTLLRIYRWAQDAGARPREFPAAALTQRATAMVGMGRLEEALPLTDSLLAVGAEAGAGLLADPLGLGIADSTYGAARLDSLIRTNLPPGGFRAYASAYMALTRDRVAEARREIDAGLALGDTVGGLGRGRLIAIRGWASLIAGDTAAGVRDLREGIQLAAGPGRGGATAFLRFQLALALSARPETRAEGIRWLRYGFSTSNEFIPTGYLALGRAWEAAGERDSAALAYGRFVDLWDKADPPLQGRVEEAREALVRLSSEPRRP